MAGVRLAPLAGRGLRWGASETPFRKRCW